jgi:hypothetical protein
MHTPARTGEVALGRDYGPGLVSAVGGSTTNSISIAALVMSVNVLEYVAARIGDGASEAAACNELEAASATVRARGGFLRHGSSRVPKSI